MEKMHRLPIAALGVLALGLTACSTMDDADTNADAAPVGTTSAECTVEDAPLRVYTNAWGPDMTDKFTEDTGIEVELADLGGGEILARVAAEQNNPQWDVVLIDGHGSVESMNQQGQLLTDYELENFANLNAEAQDLTPEDNAWIPISKHAAGLLAYNTEHVDPSDAPTSWPDLTDEAYAPVGVADPAVAAPAYPIISQLFSDLGDAAAQEYFTTLMDNGLNTYEKNGLVGQAQASGETKTAMLQEHNIYELMDEGEEVDFNWPEEGAPGAVRTAAISADTPSTCASLTFVDWLLTPETMNHLMEHGGTDSIISSFVDGTTTEFLPAARPEDPQILYPSATEAADKEAEIKDWFANASVR